MKKVVIEQNFLLLLEKTSRQQGCGVKTVKLPPCDQH
jgi:hypothetical protein